MKRLMIKKITKRFLWVAGMIWLAGCGGSTPSSPATLSEEELIIADIEGANAKTTFLLTDAPSDNFKSVKVNIKSPIVITQGNKTVFVPLPDNASVRVDLLELDEISEALASAEVPEGTIEKVRLELDSPEIVLLETRCWISIKWSLALF